MKDETCDPCCVFRLPVYLGAFANSTKRHYNRRTFNLELMDRETPPPAPPHFFQKWRGER